MSHPAVPRDTRDNRTKLRKGLVYTAVFFGGAIIGGSGGAATSGAQTTAPAAAVQTQTETRTVTATPTLAAAPAVPPAPAPAPAPVPTVAPAPVAPTAPTASIPGDGTFLVGTDIEAGTYRTTGPDNDFGCSYQRLSGTSGEFDDYIAGDVLTGPGVVTISASDVAFDTNGCTEWTPVS